MRLSKKSKLFNSTEEVVSMFLGLVIVVVVVGLVFNFIQRRKGDITLPGVSNNIDLNEVNSKETVNNTESKTYTVVKGDSLWKIAVKEYNDGFEWKEIAKVNNLNNPSVLLVGQKLIMPESKVVAAKPTEVVKPVSSVEVNQIQSGEYTIVRGDSLWKIAVRAYGDGYQWTKIWESNKVLIGNPDIIHAGNKLVIPSL